MQETMARTPEIAAQKDRPDVPEALLSARELCIFLNISRSQLHALTTRGEAPPAYRVGSSLRFDLSEVRAWLRERLVVGASA